MNILIITDKQQSNFYNIIQDIIVRKNKKEKTIEYNHKTIDNIEEYVSIYDNRKDLKSGMKFDMIDILMIEISHKIKPWD